MLSRRRKTCGRPKTAYRGDPRATMLQPHPMRQTTTTMQTRTHAPIRCSITGSRTLNPSVAARKTQAPFRRNAGASSGGKLHEKWGRHHTHRQENHRSRSLDTPGAARAHSCLCDSTSGTHRFVLHGGTPACGPSRLSPTTRRLLFPLHLIIVGGKDGGCWAAAAGATAVAAAIVRARRRRTSEHALAIVAPR